MRGDTIRDVKKRLAATLRSAWPRRSPRSSLPMAWGAEAGRGGRTSAGPADPQQRRYGRQRRGGQAGATPDRCTSTAR